LNSSHSIPIQATSKPLEGILVIDFSQFLSGPSASLRLADLGARVIKVERPETGDICRTLYISNLELDGDSSIFHAINRNKESFTADLKNHEDFVRVTRLIQEADVMIQNFRPGVMERIGLDYQSVKNFNPGIIYGEITGFGKEGPWKEAPGQDLLVQSRSGLTWLSGEPEPAPMGLALVDMGAGAHLTQGILAALVRKSITGQGAKVEVSLLESILDLQADKLTSFLNKGKSEGQKNDSFEPDGIYQTADSYITLGGGSLTLLAEVINAPELITFQGKKHELRKIIETKLKNHSTKEWIQILEANNFWCSEVLHWKQFFAHEGFKGLEMVQEVCRKNGHSLSTTRCPIRIDGQIYKSAKGSPKVGEDTLNILKELLGS